jgi:hypothetical protein
MKNRGIVLAWLVGEAIVIYRGAVKDKRPPWPGEMLLSSLVFIGLAVLSEIDALKTATVLAAWGLDAAAYLRLFPATYLDMGQKVPADVAAAQAAPASQPSAGGTTGVQAAK